MDWYNRDEIKEKVIGKIGYPKSPWSPPLTKLTKDDLLKRQKNNHRNNFTSRINDGEIVFHDEYKHKKCPTCECEWARVLHTPKFTHYAKLECRDCGYYHRWLKKSECKFK
jgi:hypothetical protein